MTFHSWLTLTHRRRQRASLRRRSRGPARKTRHTIEALESRTVLSTLTTPIVSEFLASNTNGLQDYWEEAEDWVEIYNPTSDAVDLSGWGLSDNGNQLHKWTFPAGAVIGPGEFLVVWASGNNTVAPNGEFHTNFSLSAGGEYLGLSTPDQNVVHEYAPVYPPQLTDISYGVAFVDGEPDLGQLLYFQEMTPGLPNSEGLAGTVEPVSFSVPHGFYDDSFEVELSTPTVGATIRYTTDGSTPTADHGTVYSGPIEIGETTTLRAGAFQLGGLTSAPVTQTYIFLADVIHQSPDGTVPPGWPETWGNHVVDVGMDPTIVNHPEYGGQALISALQAIPSISLTTDLAHLFDADTGIYANSLESGREWERPVSVELVNPDGSDGFQINAGLRIRGSGSAAITNPKHSLRLFFRNDYGAPLLEYPLFGDEGVDFFEKVDLRTAQNFSWSFEGNPQSNFIAEVFARDTMRDMGQPYTRSRFYHLYLNGQYWGLYQTEERPSKEYAASYFGGDDDDYDVVRPEWQTRSVSATDGEIDAWARLWEAAVAPDGLGSAEAYYKLQGKNPDGTDNPNYEVLIEVDNLIDYMTTIFYIGNQDGPITLLDHIPEGFVSNNWFAVRNRNPDARQGFLFMMRDAEFSLLGLTDNRTGPYGLGEEFDVFNPQYLHELLLANPDYVQRFQERAAIHLGPGGALATDAVIARFQARADEIDQAVIAESARWGDAQRPGNPLTRADWLADIQRVLNSYLPYRTSIVIDQFRKAGLIAPLAPPPDNGEEPPGNGEEPPVSTPPIGHYGGDSRADLALFRPGTESGEFLIELSGQPGWIQELGRPGDIPISGDFDGDGIADLALFRPVSDTMPGAAEWIILPSRGGPAQSIFFGGAGGLDLPAPADYDGDGITDIAVFRPESDLVPGAAHWFILPSRGGPAYSVLFGAAGGLDLPAPADYDGDGRADIAVFRPESDLVPGAAHWFILPSKENDQTFSDRVGGYSVLFGQAGVDQPVSIDFDGDGVADIAVFRPTTAEWFILGSTSGGYSITFGGADDIPVLGDYDGDGVADVAVFRPTTAEWFILGSTSGGYSVAFGEPGDVPVLSPLPYRMPSTALASTSGTAGSEMASGIGTARQVAQESIGIEKLRRRAALLSRSRFS